MKKIILIYLLLLGSVFADEVDLYDEQLIFKDETSKALYFSKKKTLENFKKEFVDSNKDELYKAYINFPDVYPHYPLAIFQTKVSQYKNNKKADIAMKRFNRIIELRKNSLKYNKIYTDMLSAFNKLEKTLYKKVTTTIDTLKTKTYCGDDLKKYKIFYGSKGIINVMPVMIYSNAHLKRFSNSSGTTSKYLVPVSSTHATCTK